MPSPAPARPRFEAARRSGRDENFPASPAAPPSTRSATPKSAVMLTVKNGAPNSSKPSIHDSPPLAAFAFTLATFSVVHATEPIKIGHYGSPHRQRRRVRHRHAASVSLAVEEINAKEASSAARFPTSSDIQSKQGESATAVKKLISATRSSPLSAPTPPPTPRSRARLPERQDPDDGDPRPIRASPRSATHIFRICFIDPFQGASSRKFAYTSSSQTPSRLTAVNFHSVGLSAVLRDDFAARGGEIVGEQKYNEGEKDFRAQLTALRPTKPT